MRRSLATCALVGLLLVAGPARADDVSAAVATARGGSGLAVDGDLSAFAQAASSRQASAGDISHSNLNPLLGKCNAAGEVVGKGPDVAAVFAAFAQSPGHWNTIRSSKWNALGTGAVWDAAGMVYVTVVFCQLSGAVSSPPPSAPPPPPTTAAPTSRVVASSPSPAPAAVQAVEVTKPQPPAMALQGPFWNEVTISLVIGVSPFIPEEEWRIFAEAAIS
jgi:hypothetical protein